MNKSTIMPPTKAMGCWISSARNSAKLRRHKASRICHGYHQLAAGSIEVVVLMDVSLFVYYERE
jgi:hypothetical protein